MEERPDLPKYLYDKKGIRMGTVNGKAIYFPIDDNRPKVFRGATRAGKTEAGIWYFLNKIKAGYGGCWIGNTDGRDIEKILMSLSNQDLARVVLLDHSDPTLPLGIGQIKSTGNVFQDDVLTSQWVDFFISNFGIDGQYMTQELISYSCKAVFQLEGMALVDVVNMVRSDTFREWVLQRVIDPDVLDYWSQFDGLSVNVKQQTTASFLRRANVMLKTKLLKCTFGQLAKSPLNYRQWMDQGKIVLINAPEGLGSQAVKMIMSTHMLNIWQATISRENVPQNERLPFLLVCDEPQTWMSNNEEIIDNIFSKAGKYGLRFVVLYQSDAQVKKHGGTSLLNIIFDNEPDLLQFHRKPQYHYTLTIDGYDEVLVKSPGTVKQVRSNIDLLVKASREQYNRDYQQVLNDIQRRLQVWRGSQNIVERRDESQTSMSKTSLDLNSTTDTSKSSDSFFVTD